jgi:twitching motility protein PilT
MSSGYDWERVLGQSSDAVKEEDAALDKGRSWWPFTRKQAVGEQADLAEDEVMTGTGPNGPEGGTEAEPGTTEEPGPAPDEAAAEAAETAPAAVQPADAVPPADPAPDQPNPAAAGDGAETEAALSAVQESAEAVVTEAAVASAEPAAPVSEPATVAPVPEAEATSEPPAAGAPVTAPEADAAAPDPVPVGARTQEAATPAEEEPVPIAASVEPESTGTAVSAEPVPAGPTVAEASADPAAEAAVERAAPLAEAKGGAEGNAAAAEAPAAAGVDQPGPEAAAPEGGPEAKIPDGGAEVVSGSVDSDVVAGQAGADARNVGAAPEPAGAPAGPEAAVPANEPEATATEDPAEAVAMGSVPEPTSAAAGAAESVQEPAAAVAEVPSATPAPGPEAALAEAVEEAAVAAADAGPEMAVPEGEDSPAVVLELQDSGDDEADAEPVTEVAAFEAVETAAEEAAEPEALVAEAEPAAEPELVAHIEECTLMAQDEEAVELSLYTGQETKDHVPAVFARGNTDETHMPAPVPRELIEPAGHEDRYKAFADEEDDYVPAALRKSGRDRDSSESKYFVGDDLQAPAYNTNQEDSRPLKDVHLDDILREAVERRASDIHITTGLPPMVRVDGEVVPLSYEITTPDQAQRLLYEILSDDNLEKFEQKHELDFGYTVKGLARFRVNVYMQRGSVAAALRMIPNRIPSYDELRLPTTIRDIAKRSSGLILVTGPTGSGKSTSIAAMIDDINETRQGHILTIEDPIEYLHRHKRCMVNQREMHADTYSFHSALRAVLREDPDIILVGELRDLETIEAALTLAETGHLVFGTLHTRNAPSTIDRVVDVFPADQQDQIRVLLANTIEGIISQQLLPKLGGGRVAALEIMTGIAAVKNLIREGKTHQMYSVIETSKNMGMVTMDASLAELFRGGYVSYDECLLRAVDKDTFARLAKNAA